MMKQFLLAVFLVAIVEGFLVSPNARPKVISGTRLFATVEESVPDISKMKATAMKKELESYGISTKSLFEKTEFANALKKARAEGKKPKSASGGAAPNSSTGGGEESSRDERYEKAKEEAKGMKVNELKKELNNWGISTKSFFEKSEFIKAYAEAVADNKTGPTSGGSRSARREEPRDPAYRDVAMQKIDRRQLQGTYVIDVTLAR
jgi:hypothetical protein